MRTAPLRTIHKWASQPPALSTRSSLCSRLERASCARRSRSLAATSRKCTLCSSVRRTARDWRGRVTPASEASRPCIALALLLDFLRQVLVDQRDLDAAVLAPAVGVVVRRDRRELAAPRRAQALRRHAVGLQEAHHRGGAGGGELPVGRELRRGDRHVVGMADDADHLVLVALQRLAHLLEDVLARVLERRLAGIEEELLRHLDRQHVLVLADLELALLHLVVEIADQAVILRLGLLVRLF